MARIDYYINSDSVMDALAEYFGNYAAVPLELEDLIEDIPAESVIECSVLLREADYQDKIGFIETAKILRKLVDENE